MNISYGSTVKNVTLAVKRHIRAVTFPKSSGMGMFFAIGVPLDLPEKSVSMAFYFEANYRLPGDKNSTYDEYYQDNYLNRKFAYDIIENKLESAGYPGRKCLLRAICDAASNPVTGNGLVGDIIHILFTPSSSRNENLSQEVINAEKNNNCNDYNCPMSLLDAISHYINL
ncbi:uncharacterized protein LOC103575303 [Microplitis demolitor]|uniref:uncharacterized protein LOC103575303 n=1 Tax=Microplitis demolitor TaxID=69319 RepID=UPI0006D50ED2|nr:uncharacterized protein LOC103575303 [Microplitis demolitor]